jgi:hypothetical protein
MAQPALPPDKTFRMVVKLVSTDGNELPFPGFVLIPEDRLVPLEKIAIAARDILATQSTRRDGGLVNFDMHKLMSDPAKVKAAQTLALLNGDLSSPAAVEAAQVLGLTLSDGDMLQALGHWLSELEKVWNIPQAD